MRWGPVLFAALAATGCDSADTPEPAPAPTTTASTPRSSKYPPASWGAARNDTLKGSPQAGIVVVTRTLRGKITPVDAIGIAIRFESEAGPFEESDPKGQRELDWSSTLATATFHVTTPAGTTHVLRLAETPKQSNVSKLASRAHVVHVGELGLQQFAGVGQWAAKPPKVFGTAGTYRLRIHGELDLGDDKVALQTREHVVEVAAMGRDMLPVATLRGIASRFVATVEKLDGPPKMFGHAIDDEEGNVLFRFRLKDARVVDVAMTQTGGLQGGQRLDRMPPARPGDPWNGLFERKPADR